MTDKDLAWQNRILPYMVGAVVFFALFFLLASMYQLYSLKTDIQSAPKIHSELLYQDHLPFDRQRWNSLVALEVHVLQQRYHQANISIMSRLWVRYLGFVTGMILAFMGAIFIIGKLKQGATLEIEGDGLKANLATQSPGIVLTVLGVVLMVITIVVHHRVDVRDKPSYTAVTITTTSEPPVRKPAPIDINQPQLETVDLQDCPSMDELLDKAADTHTDNDKHCMEKYTNP